MSRGSIILPTSASMSMAVGESRVPPSWVMKDLMAVDPGEGFMNVLVILPSPRLVLDPGAQASQEGSYGCSVARGPFSQD